MKISATALHALMAATMVFASAAAWSQEASPIGLWKNIDDKSGKPRALIRIAENNGALTGTIEKLFQEPHEEANPTCKKCEGALKDQALLGLTILSGMQRDGDVYTGGTILDPNNGQVYKSKLSMLDGGKKLDVRGYIGVSWLGRSQIWLREE